MGISHLKKMVSDVDVSRVYEGKKKTKTHLAVIDFRKTTVHVQYSFGHDNKLSQNTEMKFHINVFLLTFIFCFSASVRLNPLENNDKLQSINSEYVAEWQWESWPIKQNLSDKGISSPGPRVNAALWKDTTGQNWYLFGGQPINPESEKVYSDVWKYSVVYRVWERVFPFMNTQENKGRHASKIGGMVSLRVNFTDEHSQKKHRQENNIVLCGRSTKRNYFGRRKPDTEQKAEESKSLAVYGPRTSKSNTVWQIDLKDKLWTSYVCCCDTSNYDKLNPSLKEFTTETNSNKSLFNTIRATGTVPLNQTSINVKIDRTEDEVDLKQEHMTISRFRDKKKKINQMKKSDPSFDQKGKKAGEVKRNPSLPKVNLPKEIDKSASGILKNFTETVFMPKNENNVTIFKHDGDFKSLVNRTSEGEIPNDDLNENENSTENGKNHSKLVSKYCPDFTIDEEPVSWCDGYNDALITTDLSSSHIILWVFNLKTSHWSQQSIGIAEDTQWLGCTNSSMIRYAGSGEEVYILCSTQDSESYLQENCTWNATAEPTGAVSEGNSPYRSVYRISSKRLLLESLGKIKLDKFFKQPEHQEMWRNDSKTVLQVLRISNETIMLLAYEESVDLWILTKSEAHGYHFEPIENVWRGSAQKWFDKYSAPNYNFQFVSENNSAETTLILNPRTIPYTEYWPRERGRFIIRIFRNENMRNHSFGNQSREHNLTYDLLQSDINLPVVDGALTHSYNIKVIIFFGISLAIFAIFGFIIFLKKCVNCPSRVFMQNDCQKSPPVIRYSVMHDDILYPAA